MIYCTKCKRYVPDEDGECLNCLVTGENHVTNITHMS